MSSLHYNMYVMLHQHCQPSLPFKKLLWTLAHAYNVCIGGGVLWNIHKHVGKLGVAIHNMAIIIFIMWKFHNCSCSYGRLRRSSFSILSKFSENATCMSFVGCYRDFDKTRTIAFCWHAMCIVHFNYTQTNTESG